MAYPVTFYSFAKEVNSTARPSGNGQVLNCTANDRIDIINPVIVVNDGRAGGSSVPSYNYCYIPIMRRYYFVENWEYSEGLWRAYCSVDVLASYKTEIGSMTAYVLRSAAAYDGAISDAMYPAKDAWEFDSVSIDNPWQWDTYTGTYCLGVAGALSNGVGSPRYYLFNWAGFATFLGKLLSDDYVSDIIEEWGLTANSEAKAIVDPLQYITSATYLPISPPEMTTRTIQVGFGGVEVSCALIDGATITSVYSYDINNIPRHRMVASRGVYMNAAPWTAYSFDFPPFGSIELDPSKINGSIHITVTLDKPTGMAVLRVFSQNTLISYLKGSIGVTVPISQIVARGMSTLSHIQHGANLVSQVMGGMTGGGGSGKMINNSAWMVESASDAMATFTGSAIGGLASLASGTVGWVRDFIESKIPSAHNIGTVGSYAELVGRPTVYAQFLMPVDDSLRTRGRPLYAERVLNTLPGYQLIADPDVRNIAATAFERDRIVSFLVGGYYYE